MSHQTVFVKLVTIELLIPHARSLKDKRRALRPLTDGIRHQFNASVAEVGYQDKWQRAVVTVCFVGSDKRRLDSIADRLQTFCQEIRGVEIVAIDQQWL